MNPFGTLNHLRVGECNAVYNFGCDCTPYCDCIEGLGDGWKCELCWCCGRRD